MILTTRDFEKAHQDYDKAINLSPQNPKFWHSKGLAYEGRDDSSFYEEAIKMYKQALSICKITITLS
jgi:tetratricopeptide (TPR) repeat protein